MKMVLLGSFCDVLMGAFADGAGKGCVRYRSFYRRRLADIGVLS